MGEAPQPKVRPQTPARRPASRVHVTRLLQSLRARPHTIVAVPLLLFALLTALAIHGSSLAVYDSLLGLSGRPDPNLLYGHPRSIRSDEFLVNTPLAVAEARIGFPTINRNVGLGENVAVYSGTPAWNWKTVFDPTSWPYRFLPLPNAFAASWWSRDLLLLIGAYLVLMVLTRGNTVLSVGVAIALLYAPFAQWWRGAAIGAPAYGFLMLYFAFQVLIRPSPAGRLLSGVLLGYWATCFLFVLYPPFQIPVAIFAVCVFAGFAVEQRRMWMTRQRLWTAAAFVVAVGIVAVATVAYYFSFRTQINLVADTVYPGKRAETGGGYSWIEFFNGFFNVQLLSDANGAGPFGNQSEASNFFMIFPFVAPVYLVDAARRWRNGEKADPVLLSLAVCLVFLTLWVFVGLPRIVARLTFLDLVPAHRAIIGIGVADLVFLAVLLSRLPPHRGRISLLIGACAAICAFAVQLHLGLSLGAAYPSFIGNVALVVLIAAVAGGCVLLASWGLKRAFVILLVGYTLVCGFGVNPLYRGLNPVNGTALAHEIQSVVQRDGDRHRWVVYDSLIWGNYIVANGGDSLSTVYLYPQIGLWRRFDPRGRYSAVYNRYAHVTFALPAAGQGTFTSSQPDVFTVHADPCDPALRALRVRFFVFPTAVTSRCLTAEPGGQFPESGVWIYRRTA